jgi:hypothetical protein
MEPMVRRPFLLLLLAGILLSSCTAAETGTSASPAAKTTTPQPEAASPQPTAPAWAVVPLKRYVHMWKKPTDPNPAFAFDTLLAGQGFGRMLVVGQRADGGSHRWLKVQLPIRPNGATAWVRDNEVHVVPRHDELVIDLSKRTLTHLRDHKVVDRFRVGVGQPQYPTAIGTFYVWQKVNFDQWYGPYGIYALGLSGFSPVLSDWPGGGRMAIHGTSNPNDRGQQVSHGCIRVYNTDMKTLRGLPLGTPVVIRR